jgi:hypothetical protein
MSGFTNEFATLSGSVTTPVDFFDASARCNQTPRTNELCVHGPRDGIAKPGPRLLRWRAGHGYIRVHGQLSNDSNAPHGSGD